MADEKSEGKGGDGVAGEEGGWEHLRRAGQDEEESGGSDALTIAFRLPGGDVVENEVRPSAACASVLRR